MRKLPWSFRGLKPGQWVEVTIRRGGLDPNLRVGLKAMLRKSGDEKAWVTDGKTYAVMIDIDSSIQYVQPLRGSRGALNRHADNDAWEARLQSLV